jgi:hypothetical protein
MSAASKFMFVICGWSVLSHVEIETSFGMLTRKCLRAQKYVSRRIYNCEIWLGERYD